MGNTITGIFLAHILHQQQPLLKRHHGHGIPPPFPHHGHGLPSPPPHHGHGLPPPIRGNAKNAVVFPTSKRGRRVFCTRLSNGQYSLFGGKFDHAKDRNNAWTAAREAWEEGLRFQGGKYLDLSGATVSNRNGHTAYFIFQAPPQTRFEQHPKNKETVGGEWLTKRKLKELAAKGQLRFPKATLFFAESPKGLG
jgi:hypothetical protein